MLDLANPNDPKTRAAAGKLSGVVGLLCNLFLFGAKLAVGILTGSVSVTADAMHDLSDAASSIPMATPGMNIFPAWRWRR